MPITPETKDWTWVLTRPCPECGLDPAALDRATVGARTREVAAALAAVVVRPGATTRPDEGTWSALEYGCHVRDVFRLFDERLRLMLETDDPAFANWDQDATAVEQDYAAQAPQVVARELLDAAEPVAARFDGVSGAQWERTGNRSDGARFTVDSFARYFVHDPVHHLWDVRRLQPGGAST
jgi:hypothetical protein